MSTTSARPTIWAAEYFAITGGHSLRRDGEELAGSVRATEQAFGHEDNDDRGTEHRQHDAQDQQCHAERGGGEHRHPSTGRTEGRSTLGAAAELAFTREFDPSGKLLRSLFPPVESF